MKRVVFTLFWDLHFVEFFFKTTKFDLNRVFQIMRANLQRRKENRISDWLEKAQIGTKLELEPMEWLL